MSEAQSYSRHAELKAGTKNKFYTVEVEPTEGARYRLTFVYGRIGTEGRRIDKGSFKSFNYAKQLADEQIETKIEKKGYKEVTAMQMIASAVEDLSERKTKGLEPVEIQIHNFNAGASEKRMQTFARKYVDKLNLIRASRYEMDEDAYRHMVEAMFRSYTNEYERIEDSATHGLNIGTFALQRARNLFLTLKDNAGVGIYHYRVPSHRHRNR